MRSFKLYILAADRVFYEGECESLTVPTPGGLYGIWAHHSNLITAIVAGMLSYREPGNKDSFAAVSQGMMKVENNEVLVLVDSAERPEEIDENRARREIDEAREALLQKRSREEYLEAQAVLARAINRLKVKNRYSHR